MEQSERENAQRVIYLVAGFIKNELNFGEQQELSAWKNESLKNQMLFDELVREDNRSSAVNKMQDFGTEESLEHLRQKMASLQRGGQKRVNGYWYAAGLILVWGLVFLFTQRNMKPPQLMTISVPYGKVMHFTLPDSSMVWLNAGSVLQYPEKFTGSSRNIRLKDGQAFFAVRHDTTKPFMVQANGVNVTVLGTSFEVRAFADEKDDKVTVSSGKVGILANGINQPATMLLPDEQAVISKTSKQISTRKISSGDIAAWRQNKLVFENENFGYVIHALQRKYNVRISIENKNLLQLKITLRLDNQPLANVLSVLGFSNNFTYKQENEQLIVIR